MRGPYFSTVFENVTVNVTESPIDGQIAASPAAVNAATCVVGTFRTIVAGAEDLEGGAAATVTPHKVSDTTRPHINLRISLSSFRRRSSTDGSHQDGAPLQDRNACAWATRSR